MNIDDLKLLISQAIKDVATKTDVSAIALDIQALRYQNDALTCQLAEMQERYDLLERQVEMLHRKANECNLVIHLPKDTTKKADEVARETCASLLKVPQNDLHVKKAKEIPTRNNNKSLVILELSSGETVDNILSVARSLKGSGIVIHREQSVQFRKKRQDLFAIRNKLKELNSNANILVKTDKIVINNHEFVYKTGRGLLMSDNDISFVNRLFGESALSFFKASTHPSTEPERGSVGNVVHQSGPITSRKRLRMAENNDENH